MFVCVDLMAGCAATLPPQELHRARQAYAYASASAATQRVPAALRDAREALVLAEQSFIDDPNSKHTRKLAGLAWQKAILAKALGVSAANAAMTAQEISEVSPAAPESVKPR